MERHDWEQLEVLCINDKCSVQIQGFDNKPRLERRKMKLARFSFWGDAIFMCPACGGERKFHETMDGGYREVH